MGDNLGIPHTWPMMEERWDSNVIKQIKRNKSYCSQLGRGSVGATPEQQRALKVVGTLLFCAPSLI